MYISRRYLSLFGFCQRSVIKSSIKVGHKFQVALLVLTSGARFRKLWRLYLHGVGQNLEICLIESKLWNLIFLIFWLKLIFLLINLASLFKILLPLSTNWNFYMIVMPVLDSTLKVKVVC